jgi:hypothetical protein
VPSLFGLTAMGFSLPVLDSVHLECGCPSIRIDPLTITDHHCHSASFSIIQHHSASLTMEYHERKRFFPWHTLEMAPWLQVAVVLAQLCTVRVLAVRLWHDQTWKPVVWRLRATQPWGHREMQCKLPWKGKKLTYLILLKGHWQCFCSLNP